VTSAAVRKMASVGPYAAAALQRREFSLEARFVAFRAVELARMAMTGVDGGGNRAGRQAISDGRDRNDSRAGHGVRHSPESERQLVIRQPGGDRQQGSAGDCGSATGVHAAQYGAVTRELDQVAAGPNVDAQLGPPSLGLDAAHGGVSLGTHVAHAVAMGDLIEAVFGSHRADANGFKEDLMAGVTRGKRTIIPKFTFRVCASHKPRWPMAASSLLASMTCRSVKLDTPFDASHDPRAQCCKRIIRVILYEDVVQQDRTLPFAPTQLGLLRRSRCT
jgi:hypothetical protein